MWMNSEVVFANDYVVVCSGVHLRDLYLVRLLTELRVQGDQYLHVHACVQVCMGMRWRKR